MRIYGTKHIAARTAAKRNANLKEHGDDKKPVFDSARRNNPDLNNDRDSYYRG